MRQTSIMNTFDPVRLGVIAALFTVIGDVLELCIAVNEFKQSEIEKANTRKDLEKQIDSLQQQLNELKGRR